MYMLCSIVQLTYYLLVIYQNYILDFKVWNLIKFKYTVKLENQKIKKLAIEIFASQKTLISIFWIFYQQKNVSLEFSIVK